MKRSILTVLLLLSGNVGAARAVPVVPNFTQGSMTSNTTTTSTVVETINSMDYNTGWQYVVTGINVEASGNLPPTGTAPPVCGVSAMIAPTTIACIRFIFSQLLFPSRIVQRLKCLHRQQLKLSHPLR